MEKPNIEAILAELDAKDPIKAAELRARIIDAANGKTEQLEWEGVKFNVQVRFRLEKYEGEIEPGKQPFEVIEGGDGMETVVTRTGENHAG